MYGVAFLKEDDQESYQFAIQSFLNVIEDCNPCTLIIERQSTMKNAIETIIKEKKNITLLYCF